MTNVLKVNSVVLVNSQLTYRHERGGSFRMGYRKNKMIQRCPARWSQIVGRSNQILRIRHSLHRLRSQDNS